MHLFILVMFAPFWSHVREAVNLRAEPNLLIVTYEPNLLIVTYEQLKADLKKTITTIAHFLGEQLEKDN